MDIAWSDWQGDPNPSTTARTGKYFLIIQQVTPSPATCYRNRRYEIQYKGEPLATGYCNGTEAAEAIIGFILHTPA